MEKKTKLARSICTRRRDGRSEIRNMLLKKKVFGISVTQEKTFRMNSLKQAIERITDLSLCRLCMELSECMQHIVSGCNDYVLIIITRKTSKKFRFFLLGFYDET